MREFDTPKTWEQWPRESAQAFEKFKVYRDLGAKRSLGEAIKLINPDYRYSRGETANGGTPRIPGSILRLYTLYNWKERAAAWDAEVERRLLEEDISEAKKMRRRHAKVAQLGTMLLQKAQEVALRKLAQLSEEEIALMDPLKLVNMGIFAAQSVAGLQSAERIARLGGKGEFEPMQEQTETVEELEYVWPAASASEPGSESSSE